MKDFGFCIEIIVPNVETEQEASRKLYKVLEEAEFPLVEVVNVMEQQKTYPKDILSD